MAMIEIFQTTEFSNWIRDLKDKTARFRIVVQIDKLKLGNFKNSKTLGGGLFELKVDHGPGYRVYFIKKEQKIVILLCGGDKSTQQKDITKAQKMVKELKDGTTRHQT